MSFTLRRPAARCVLFDRRKRLFLIRPEDPTDPYKPEWLEIPGGGMAVGEDSASACLRELREAPGIMVIDKREAGGYVTPVECVGDFATFISRIRQDSTIENVLSSVGPASARPENSTAPLEASFTMYRTASSPGPSNARPTSYSSPTKRSAV